MTENTPRNPKSKGGSRKAKSTAPPPFDHRMMEKQMAAMTRLLEEKDFATIDEANAFLQQFVASGQPLDLTPPAPQTPLEEAQDIIYEAMAATGKRRLSLARKALEVSPDCADAYVLLAEDVKTPREARAIYEQGIQAGERALGNEYFEDFAGDFWGLLETRPYMRARQGLAETLWELGEREAAIGHAQDMLRLNHGDNQGMRYLLAGWLATVGDDDALGRLLDGYPKEASASWAYTRLLLSFRTHGPGAMTDKAFRAAVAANPFVPMYMLAMLPEPKELPEYYEMGSPDEAIVYLVEAGEAWAENPDAIEWMVDALVRLAPERTRKPRAARKPKPNSKPAKVWILDPKATDHKGKRS